MLFFFLFKYVSFYVRYMRVRVYASYVLYM